MSSCPTKDIHSVYLDGELPMAYLAEYESHVETCPKCAATLAKMRAISAAFKSDGDAMAKDDVFMAQSYERLMNRMSYSRVTKKAQRFSDTAFKPAYFVPMAAAAALLVAVFLPMRFTQKQEAMPVASHIASATPIMAQQVSMQKKNVVINGTISPSTISASVPLDVSSASIPEISLGEIAQIFPVAQQTSAESKSNIFTDFDIFVPQINQKRQLVLKLTPAASDGGESVWTLTLDADNSTLP